MITGYYESRVKVHLHKLQFHFSRQLFCMLMAFFTIEFLSATLVPSNFPLCISCTPRCAYYWITCQCPYDTSPFQSQIGERQTSLSIRHWSLSFQLRLTVTLFDSQNMLIFFSITVFTIPALCFLISTLCTSPNHLSKFTRYKSFTDKLENGQFSVCALYFPLCVSSSPHCAHHPISCQCPHDTSHFHRQATGFVLIYPSLYFLLSSLCMSLDRLSVST